MKDIKKLEELQDLLMQANKLVLSIKEDDKKSETQLDEWMKDRVELWCRIYKEGSAISKKRLHDIWKQMGKDTRGLGGFFTGKYASLIHDADGNVVLTEIASNYIMSWTGKSIQEYGKRYEK